MRSSALLVFILLLAASVAVSSAMISTMPVTEAVPATLPAPGSEQGYFSINSVPSGGDVYFDSAFWGETPVVVTVSTTGNPNHNIRITLAGYEEWISTYNGNPMAGQTIPITAQLDPSAQTGNIQVVSTPSGAMVTLDRSQSANTPYTFYNIPVGSHEVSVYMSGYQTFYTSVSVNEGQTAYVNAVLQPVVTTGTLSVSSSPSGAAVYVDGIYQGVTSTTVGNLVPGSHSVRLTKAGYQDWTGSVSISAGSTTYLNPTLVVEQQPQYATVSISSNPSGASVYGDGVYVGQTRSGSPLVFTSVKPGVHTILLTKSGYQDYQATQSVVAGQDYVVSVTLNPVQNPTTGGISVISAPSQAEVYLNNAFKGLTPITLDSLSPGSYTVLIKLSGYQDWQATQQVTAGQTAQVSATLLPSATPTPTQTGLLPLVVLTGIGIMFLAARKRS
ncbi:MAG: PEGA domain-containing protein [Methanoregulaceae archaeon]|nr:PEGA domain-containing protein [Methanoregulaceae archaeon]